MFPPDSILPILEQDGIAGVMSGQFAPEAGPAAGDGLLLEAAGVSTDFILLENGDFILQES